MKPRFLVELLVVFFVRPDPQPVDTFGVINTDGAVGAPDSHGPVTANSLEAQ